MMMTHEVSGVHEDAMSVHKNFYSKLTHSTVFIILIPSF